LTSVSRIPYYNLKINSYIQIDIVGIKYFSCLKPTSTWRYDITFPCCVDHNTFIGTGGIQVPKARRLLSVDWAAVLVALVVFILVKIGLVQNIPW